MKFSVAGDSHGQAMYGLIEGLPAGFPVSIDEIDKNLQRRQRGYGRGKRMGLEHDRAIIKSGLWNDLTTGAPILIEIANLAPRSEKETRSIPRPGHADYAAWTKYRLSDLTIYAERSSARWTAALVSIGSIACQMLSKLGIEIVSSVIAIGKIQCPIPDSVCVVARDASPVYCHDKLASGEMVAEIEKAIDKGDTLGGIFAVSAYGLPSGIGGYGELFERLDSKIGRYFLAIPSVKGVFVGNPDVSLPGSQYHDPFAVSDGKVSRLSNNAGGVEGGISNGQPLVVVASVKPIPTLENGIDSVNLKSMNLEKTPYVRSDVTAVPAASVVGESMLGLLLLESILEKYGNDSFDLLKGRLENESLPCWNDGLGEKHHR
ncbi:MAG TPA: chorismate synthase [Mesotoga infera]|jgi:chorismate synthase|nr:chorismate synthase [Mesotoga sp.]NLI07770.1 chorismate synthase [Thermotogaceae bacterium]HNS67777.1 chorismate synthase [Mesotoga infera]HOI35136.1 chorismate synthase [Mesotoga infera]HON26961.1 chorismate synthase [Mesotoga infera]